jgi:hypothetical protein
MNARIDSLHLIESACWREMGRAAAERDHPWRQMVLATVDADQTADARTVLLREVQADSREITFYTDARAQKVGQIRANPHGTVVMWSSRMGWQLRLKVRLRVDTGGPDAVARWTEMKLSPVVHDYLSPMAPGTPLAEPSKERGGRGFFALIRAQVLSVDWLELHPDGHRRAVFDLQGARWVQP